MSAVARTSGAALALLLLVGCGAAPGWVDAAGAAHRRADAALAREDLPAARAALEGFLDLPAPARVAAEDQRVVRQDILYRLAELGVAQDPAGALRWADQGLALGEREDLFSANLWIARGHAHQKLGDDRAAAEDYHRALRINEAMLGAEGASR